MSDSTKAFTVDASLIKHLIQSQAGTVSKALLELVSNSIDAGATGVTVDVSSDMRKLTITDDGCGFKSEAQITQLFGTFGFDHNTEEELARNRSFGRFGLGRGQALTFGACHWTSNEFVISVDLNKNETKDIFYDLKSHPQSLHKGCKVEIDLYQSLSMWDFNNLTSALLSQLKYVATPILVNGKLATKDLSTVSWTAREDDILFKKSSGDSTGGLNIFNQGVYVSTVPHSKLGVSGDLSTTEPLLLNMARNEVLYSQCPMWARVKSVVAPYSAAKKKAMSYHDANFILSSWLSGELSTSDVREQALFLNILGRRNRLSYIQSFADQRITMADSDQSQIGENVHRDKLAYVLSPKQVGDLGYSDAKEFIDAVNDRLAEPQRRYVIKELVTVSFNELADNYSGDYRVLSEDKLSAVGRLRLEALSSINGDLVHTINQALGYRWNEGLNVRKLQVGESDSASAWTDSCSFIGINKEDFSQAFEHGSTGLNRLLGILIHEYCHDIKSDADHVHGVEFYNRFHDVILSECYKPSVLVNSILRNLINLRKKAKLAVPMCEVEQATDDSIAKLIITNNKVGNLS